MKSTCEECGEGIHLEYAGEDMGVLAGASVWEHDRSRSLAGDDHEPRPQGPKLGGIPDLTQDEADAYWKAIER